MKLQISKRTLQEWSKIELRHAALREPQLKKPFVPSAPRYLSCRMLQYVAIRESRIASRLLE